MGKHIPLMAKGVLVCRLRAARCRLNRLPEGVLQLISGCLLSPPDPSYTPARATATIGLQFNTSAGEGAVGTTGSQIGLDKRGRTVWCRKGCCFGWLLKDVPAASGASF